MGEGGGLGGQPGRRRVPSEDRYERPVGLVEDLREERELLVKQHAGRALLQVAADDRAATTQRRHDTVSDNGRVLTRQQWPPGGASGSCRRASTSASRGSSAGRRRASGSSSRSSSWNRAQLEAASSTGPRGPVAPWRAIHVYTHWTSSTGPRGPVAGHSLDVINGAPWRTIHWTSSTGPRGGPFTGRHQRGAVAGHSCVRPLGSVNWGPFTCTPTGQCQQGDGPFTCTPTGRCQQGNVHTHWTSSTGPRGGSFTCTPTGQCQQGDGPFTCMPTGRCQ